MPLSEVNTPPPPTQLSKFIHRAPLPAGPMSDPMCEGDPAVLVLGLRVRRSFRAPRGRRRQHHWAIGSGAGYAGLGLQTCHRTALESAMKEAGGVVLELGARSGSRAAVFKVRDQLCCGLLA